MGFFAKAAQQTDIAMAVALIGMIAMLILPLPEAFLDLGLVLNLAGSCDRNIRPGGYRRQLCGWDYCLPALSGCPVCRHHERCGAGGGSGGPVHARCHAGQADGD